MKLESEIFPGFKRAVEKWFHKKWLLRDVGDGLIQVAKREGFDGYLEILSKKGAIVEIAGPTNSGYYFYDFGKHTPLCQNNVFPRNRVKSSNLYPGAPRWDGVGGEFLGFSGEVDFLADARKMPLKDESVEIVFSSCMGEIPSTGVKEIIKAGFGKSVPEVEKQKSENKTSDGDALRRKTLVEAWRILCDGGILVWQGAKDSDVEFAKKLGFTMAQYELYRSHYHKVIFIKEKYR